jgi:hypothetical protein
VAEPLLEPMPVEPPAPIEGDVVEPVEPPTEVLLSVVPVVLPALPVVPVLPVVLLLEPTPAEPAPSSRRQRSFSGPAAIRSQRALPRAAVVSVVEDVLPLTLGEVVLPLTLGEVVLLPTLGEEVLPPTLGDVVLPPTLGDVVLAPPVAPVLDCEVLLSVLLEAPVEPLVVPEPDVCAKAVSENARIAAVPIAFNIWTSPLEVVVGMDLAGEWQLPCRRLFIVGPPIRKRRRRSCRSSHRWRRRNSCRCSRHRSPSLSGPRPPPASAPRASIARAP